jgi:nitrate/TMAO reductase-like tetraheme cytochrome c subunit
VSKRRRRARKNPANDVEMGLFALVAVGAVVGAYFWGKSAGTSANTSTTSLTTTGT